MGWPPAVYVVPGLGIGVAGFVGAGADHFAIFVVELLKPCNDFSTSSDV